MFVMSKRVASLFDESEQDKHPVTKQIKVKSLFESNQLETEEKKFPRLIESKEIKQLFETTIQEKHEYKPSALFEDHSQSQVNTIDTVLFNTLQPVLTVKADLERCFSLIRHFNLITLEEERFINFGIALQQDITKIIDTQFELNTTYEKLFTLSKNRVDEIHKRLQAITVEQLLDEQPVGFLQQVVSLVSKKTQDDSDFLRTSEEIRQHIEILDQSLTGCAVYSRHLSDLDQQRQTLARELDILLLAGRYLIVHIGLIQQKTEQLEALWSVLQKRVESLQITSTILLQNQLQGRNSIQEVQDFIDLVQNVILVLVPSWKQGLDVLLSLRRRRELRANSSDLENFFKIQQQIVQKITGVL